MMYGSRFYGLDFYKVIGKGDFEEMRKLFEVFEEGLGRDYYFFPEDFRRSLCRFWSAMKEKLWSEVRISLS